MVSLGIQWEMVAVSVQKSNDTCHLVTLETLISNRAKVRKTHLNTSCPPGKKRKFPRNVLAGSGGIFKWTICSERSCLIKRGGSRIRVTQQSTRVNWLLLVKLWVFRDAHKSLVRAVGPQTCPSANLKNSFARFPSHGHKHRDRCARR